MKLIDQNTFLERFTWLIGEIIDQLHVAKSIPNLSINFIECKETCKLYVVTSNRTLHMRRRFQF